MDRSRLSGTERRALWYGPLYRILGMPVVAGLGLVNTAIIVRQTGAAVFGLVSLVATVSLLVPFMSVGVGSTVISASAGLVGETRNPDSCNVIRRAFHVLFGIAGVLIVAALVVMTLDGWTVLIGFSSGPADRWAITLAAGVFALIIPAGLGVCILIGIDRNPLATLVSMSGPVFGLAITLALYAFHVDGIWYAVPALAGVLLGQTVGTILALRISGLGRSAFGRVSGPGTGRRLLAGSMWLFIVSAGLPVGLWSGRILLAHLSTPLQLSEYALMAQIYALGGSVMATAGLAYWPIFVKRQHAIEETVRMWWRVTATFAGVAALAAGGMAALGPLVARFLSGGRINVSFGLALAFGALIFVQAVHIPATVLLVRPNEARWQALWTLVMAGVSIGTGASLVAAGFGAVGVVYASALAILLAQVLPDLVWVPTLVRSRPREAVSLTP